MLTWLIAPLTALWRVVALSMSRYHSIMSALTLPTLDEDTLRLLVRRAAQNARGVEEEVVAIVREAVTRDKPIAAMSRKELFEMLAVPGRPDFSVPVAELVREDRDS